MSVRWTSMGLMLLASRQMLKGKRHHRNPKQLTNQQVRPHHAVQVVSVQECCSELRSLLAFWPLKDAKPEEYYQTSDQIKEALDQLGEQLQQNMEAQLAEWVHSTEEYPQNLWLFHVSVPARGANEQVPGSTWTEPSAITTCSIRMRRSRSTWLA